MHLEVELWNPLADLSFESVDLNISVLHENHFADLLVVAAEFLLLRRGEKERGALLTVSLLLLGIDHKPLWVHRSPISLNGPLFVLCESLVNSGVFRVANHCQCIRLFLRPSAIKVATGKVISHLKGLILLIWSIVIIFIELFLRFKLTHKTSFFGLFNKTTEKVLNKHRVFSLATILFLAFPLLLPNR